MSNSLLCLPFLSPSNRRFSATGGSAVFLDSWGNRITRRGGISDSCGLWLLRRRQRGRLGDHGRHGSRWRRRRRHDRRDIRRSRHHRRHVVGNRRGRHRRRRDDGGVVGAGGNRRQRRRRGRRRRRHDGRDHRRRIHRSSGRTARRAVGLSDGFFLVKSSGRDYQLPGAGPAPFGARRRFWSRRPRRTIWTTRR